MLTNPFIAAEKLQSRLRLAMVGPTGSGKTFSALRIAALMLGGQETSNYGVSLPRREGGLARIAFIDTERGSARKYSDLFTDGLGKGLFDVLDMERNQAGAVDPAELTEAIKQAGKHGYEFLIIDSLSHAWEGVLDAKDKRDRRGGNSFANWREVTPIHNRLVDAILDYPGHTIGCMRVKMDYVIEEDPANPKRTRVRKVGLKSIQREGVEYEFDVVVEMNETFAIIGKTRCHSLTKLDQVEKPGQEIARLLNDWLGSGGSLPLTRTEFVEEMGKLGYQEEDQIGQRLQELDLLNTVTGPNRYEVMLEKVKEAVSPFELPEAG